MEKKIGLYICSGCKIGKCVDTSAMCSAISDPEIKICTSHTSLCSVSGYETIRQGIEKEGLNALVLAACSPREKTGVFDFPGTLQLERVNLRELVAWGIEGEPEDIQMAAVDYLRMGLTRIKTTQLPGPYVVENLSKSILVIGGGITGVTAALEGAKAGYTVHLVEKEAKLGGWSSRLSKQMPSAPPFDTLKEPVIHAKIMELQENPLITIHTSTQIERIEGQPGAFEISLLNGRNEKIKAGAIVAAMGWKPYDAGRLSHLGYGKFKGVVTNIEFEELIRNHSMKQLPPRILFIQCAGSRDKEHLPYCSNYCCGTSLKQAKYIREISPESSVFIIYKDMRTPGLYEGFYKEIQKDAQVFFTKGEVVNVDEMDGRLWVDVKDTLLGEDISISVDMIVLATGMTPASTSELNLTYRQGKGLPELKYNFSDSHFICFPYETRRTGIYTAGTLRAPMDIASSMEDAGGAMLKAIQCIESTGRGESVHPRSGDLSYPELYMDRCTDCKRCTEECPFGMYDETEKGTPLPNPARCRRCGICLGSCPERVINFSNYSINSISAMIKAIEIPDEFEEKPRILAFVCENDAYPAFDMAARKGLKWSAWIRIIPVRCLGSINKVWISDALSCGFDGIMQIGCKPGDDYQCHFIHGSELTKTRGENIQETLRTMMLEPERIRTEFVEITDYHRLPEIISEYAGEVEQMGPNPFKGM
jgi:quinone-modifying oxidoreductase, subunit QmoB